MVSRMFRLLPRCSAGAGHSLCSEVQVEQQVGHSTDALPLRGFDAQPLGFEHGRTGSMLDPRCCKESIARCGAVSYDGFNGM